MSPPNRAVRMMSSRSVATYGIRQARLTALPDRATRRARLSRVVTATLLSKNAEVVALSDFGSELPEDRVRN